MKKLIILFTALGAFMATSCKETKPTSKSTAINRGSTQRIGQSGSNGTGDGIKHNMLNGTGDGLSNQQWKTYSQQLQEKGVLASHSAHPVDHPATNESHQNKKAPSEAEADVKELKH